MKFNAKYRFVVITEYFHQIMTVGELIFSKFKTVYYTHILFMSLLVCKADRFCREIFFLD